MEPQPIDPLLHEVVIDYTVNYVDGPRFVGRVTHLPTGIVIHFEGRRLFQVRNEALEELRRRLAPTQEV